jgi:Carboxypeptidase regulatory-like domain/TonB-dependent Receptor Plug Domain
MERLFHLICGFGMSGRSRRLKRIPFWLMIWMAGTVAVHAQTAQTGALTGMVTDPSGRVVSGVTVKVTSATTGQTRMAMSQSDGKYLVPLLPPDAYKVEISQKNFKTTEFDRVRINVTETATLNVQLQLGAVTEIITVEAEAQQLDTSSSALGHVTDQRIVEDVPLVTRNYSQILGLSPGVSAELFDAKEIGRGGVDDSFVTGGSHDSDNNFQMNGVEINDLQSSGHYSGGVATPNPDSIQEFKVQTSQYDATYGRNAGANVDVVTKSGTNTWHGDVWEYFRNEDLNANDYFRNQTKQPRGILRQNQFGFTVGGPIVKNKLMFFTSYQGTRQQNGLDINCSSSVFLPVMTSSTDRTDPNAVAASVGPATAYGGVALPGVLVDGTNVSPQAMTLFNAKLPNGQFVIPNAQTIVTDPTTGLPEGFSTFSSPCPYNEDQFVTNLDWIQSSKSSLQGRFFFANSDATFTLPQTQAVGETVPGAPLTNPQNFRNFSLTHTYAFNPVLVNQAQFGFHRTHSGTVQSFPVTYPDLGSTVPVFDQSRAVIDVLGGINMGGNGQTVLLGQNTYVFQDTVSWVRGRHSFRFGGGITQAQDNMSEFAFGAYSVFFNYPGLLYGQAPFNPFETLDLAGISQRNWRARDADLFVQDDIKITPRLTINLGLRYERLGDISELNGRNSSLDIAHINPTPPTAAQGGSLDGILVSDNFPGTRPPGVISSGNNLGTYGNGQNTWNPRMGFAWSLPGTDRFVLRGGYGIYRQRTTGQLYLQQISNQPFGLIRAVVPNLSNGFDAPMPPDPGPFPQFSPYAAPDPVSGDPGTSLTPILPDPHIRPPILQRYSLNLQTQIARDFAAEIGYSGMRGTHMIVFKDINQANLASVANPINGQTTNTVTNIPFRVPYEGFSASQMIDLESYSGFAWYNAFEASLSKRFSHGFQFLASYTFARDLANVWGSTTAANGGIPIGNNNDPRFSYGPDDFVRPHRFVFSGVYELPGPANRHSLAGQTLGGWKLAGVMTVQSGRRLALLNLDSFNIHGTVYDFARVVPGCNIETSGSVTHRLNNWVNQNCIAPYPVIGDPDPPGTCADPSLGSIPCATDWGNSRMGILHGPGEFNTDLSLIKLFPLSFREGMNVEFRSEFFNVFNHPNFDIPDQFVSDGPGFGKITQMQGNPRIIQFALKVNF